MAETVVTHTEEPPDPTTSAAAIAGAMAGAAGEKADNAEEAAEAARLQAEEATRTAQLAASDNFDKVSAEEARRIAREESAAYMNELVAAAAVAKEEKPPTPDPDPTEIKVPKQVLPPSVEKANKKKNKRTFNDWWHDNVDDD